MQRSSAWCLDVTNACRRFQDVPSNHPDDQPGKFFRLGSSEPQLCVSRTICPCRNPLLFCWDGVNVPDKWVPFHVLETPPRPSTGTQIHDSNKGSLHTARTTKKAQNKPLVRHPPWGLNLDRCTIKETHDAPWIGAQSSNTGTRLATSGGASLGQWGCKSVSFVSMWPRAQVLPVYLRTYQDTC